MNEKYYSVYYSELGQYMLAQNLTVKQVAKACNVGTKTVYNWVNKTNKPKNVNIFLKLSEVLNVDVETLKKYFIGD